MPAKKLKKPLAEQEMTTPEEEATETTHEPEDDEAAASDAPETDSDDSQGVDEETDALDSESSLENSTDHEPADDDPRFGGVLPNIQPHLGQPVQFFIHRLSTGHEGPRHAVIANVNGNGTVNLTVFTRGGDVSGIANVIYIKSETTPPMSNYCKAY